MIGELISKALNIPFSEVQKKHEAQTDNGLIDISKRIDASEITYDTNKLEFDTDKRINISDIGVNISRLDEDKNQKNDITEIKKDNNKEEIDIKRRIQSDNNSELHEVVRDYIDDLKKKSDCPETITNTLDVSQLKIESPEITEIKREEFDKNKTKLREEWEKKNNMEWPRYKTPVYNEKGIMIRAAGMCYDAHHIQPLGLGGKNEANNITPLSVEKHSEIHSKSGSCTKVVENIGGR